MILYKTEYQELQEFVAEHAGDEIGENAVRAHLYYRSSYGNYKRSNYVVIKVKEYYAITRVESNMISYIKIEQYVQPFDDKKVYPLQKIKKEIDFVY